MINADDIDSDPAHLREVAVHLRGSTEKIPSAIGPKGSIGYALHEKLPVALEEEFCDRTNRPERSGTQSASFLVHGWMKRKAFATVQFKASR